MIHTWPEFYLNAAMMRNWDVLQAIVKMMNRLPHFPPRFVKGHQDRQQSSNLSFEAQLNIKADQIAGTYNYPPDLSKTQALHLTGNSALFQLPQDSITSHFKNTC